MTLPNTVGRHSGAATNPSPLCLFPNRLAEPHHPPSTLNTHAIQVTFSSLYVLNQMLSRSAK